MPGRILLKLNASWSLPAVEVFLEKLIIDLMTKTTYSTNAVASALISIKNKKWWIIWRTELKIITCSSITSTLTNKMKVRINKTTLPVSIIITAHLINRIKTTTKHNGHNSDLTQDNLNRRIVDKITDRGTYTQRPQQLSWDAKCSQDSAWELTIRRTIVIKIK